jgi:hypothetical protein
LKKGEKSFPEKEADRMNRVAKIQRDSVDKKNKK